MYQLHWITHQAHQPHPALFDAHNINHHQPHHHTNKKSIAIPFIILHVALTQSHSAVIVQLPGLIQVTKPVWSTNATVKSLLDQWGFFSTASSGDIVAVNCSVCQASDKLILLSFKVILLAWTGALSK